jgi:excisionase family DNA binding protein
MATPSRPHRPTRSNRPAVAPTVVEEPAGTGAGPLLYTPAEAARRLRVRESWLRKKAAAREVPCTFLGRHLRFSPTDLATIVAACARPAVGRRARRRPATNVRDSDLTSPAERSVDPPRPDDHTSDGSTRWPG